MGFHSSAVPAKPEPTKPATAQAINTNFFIVWVSEWSAFDSLLPSHARADRNKRTRLHSGGLSRSTLVFQEYFILVGFLIDRIQICMGVCRYCHRSFGRVKCILYIRASECMVFLGAMEIAPSESENRLNRSFGGWQSGRGSVDQVRPRIKLDALTEKRWTYKRT